MSYFRCMVKAIVEMFLVISELVDKKVELAKTLVYGKRFAEI